MFLFDRDTDFKRLEPDAETQLFTGEISNNWGVNDVPNGGYLMAVVANAMMQSAEKNATPLITVNYISRCEPGKADISVETFSSSRQFDRLQAILTQGGQEKIRAFGTFAIETDGAEDVRYEKSPPDVLPVDECFQMPPISDKYSIFSNLDVRLDPSCAGWMSGQYTDISEHKGWIKFSDDRPLDALSILLLADSFPPPVFVSQGMVAWVPTLEFSVNVRSVPETKWLKCVFRTRFINNGLLEEDGEVWDENDNLIAVSRQIAQYKKQDD